MPARPWQGCKAPLFHGDEGQSSPQDAEHPALLHCGRDVPTLRAAVTSPALLEPPQTAPHGLGPLSSSQPEPGIVLAEPCLTGRDWDTLEEGLGLQGRVEGERGPFPKHG